MRACRLAVRADALERLPLNPVAFARDLLKMRLANEPWDKVASLIETYFKPTADAASAARGPGC